jgi:hypothetical protein
MWLLIILSLVLIFGVCIGKLGSNSHGLKKQASLLQISETEMRDYTDVGCVPWQRIAFGDPAPEGCYLHTYKYFENRSEESTVRGLLKSTGWEERKDVPSSFILPRGIHALDRVFFKRTGNDIYCAGFEYGNEGKIFTLHLFSNADENCKRMISASF